jgi:hypothetical protein
MKVTITLLIFACLFSLETRAQTPVPIAAHENGMRADLSAGYQQRPIYTSSMLEADSVSIIYPNPATDQLWIHVSPAVARIFRVTFFDSNERRLNQEEFSVEPGDQKILLTLPANNSGQTYYVRVEESGKSMPVVLRVFRQL